MTLPVPQYPPVVGESIGERIARVVKFYAGCSLSNRRDELAALVGEAAVDWQTNCETFAIGVYRAVGVDVPAVQAPLVNGMEGSVVEQAAQRAGGWQKPTSAAPPVGALMHYRSNPYRVDAQGRTIYDDHVEFVTGPGEHGGGGRANNEITVVQGDYHFSVGRPLYGWIDPEMLPVPDVTDPGDPAAGGGPLPAA